MRRGIDEIVRVTELHPADQNRVLDFACHLLAQPCEIDISPYLCPVGLGADLPIKHQSRLESLLREEAMIMQHPVAAMLVSSITGSYRDKNLHELLKRFVLKGAIRFPDRTDAIKMSCRRVRLIKEDNTFWILDRIRDSSDDLGSIVACLKRAEDEIEDQPDSEENREKFRRCTEFRRLLEWLHNDRPGTRTGGQRSKLPVESEGIVDVALGDDLGDGDLQGRLLQAISRTDKDGADSESLPSQQYYDLGLQDPKSYGSYEAKQRRDARHALDEIRKRAGYPPCGWASLTNNEVRLTLQECYSLVDETGSIASVMIILSIMLGRKPTTLLGLPIRRRHVKADGGEYWYVTSATVRLVFELPMPKFPSSDFTNRVLQASLTRIKLPIPQSIERVLRDLAGLSPEYRQSGSQLATEISDRIRQLNKNHALRLNEPRLASYMLTHLASDGVDEVIVRRLRGEPLSRNVPQHYDGCPSELTYRIYYGYCQGLMNLAGHLGEVDEPACPSAPLGSQLQAERRFIKKYFSTWSEHLAALRAKHSNPIEFHNDFVLGTYAVLAVTTGHRPVTQMFENIRDYDPISRELFIADKNSRHGSDCRCVALGEVAAQQLNYYVEHLHVFRVQVGSSTAAVRAAKRALSGDGPLLFRLRQVENARDIVEGFDPGRVRDWLADKWPVDLRWSRHLFCTESRTQLLPFEAINASLGHDGLGPANFNPFSGMSFAKMQNFAARHDTLMSELGVSPIQGLAL